MPEISRYAVIERTAELADDVRVGPFSYIGPHVRIGPGCVIDNSVTITGRTVVGANNRVFPMAVIGAGEAGCCDDGQVIIGDANSIREHVTIYSHPDSPTRIGTDNLIMIACQIGAGSTVGSHCALVNCTYVGAGARVEDYVRTSGFIVIRPAVTVGAYTMTIGYAEIDRDAPPFAMVQGPPLRVRSVNTENLRRCGFGADDVQALKAAFRELFDGAGEKVNQQSLQKMLKTPPENPHVRRLAEALQQAQAARKPS